MLFRVDPSSGVPLYQQIIGQVKRCVSAGTLNAGDRLPTVRELAGRLKLNSNTVARAYRELERERVVETRRGLGTYVAQPEGRLESEERRSLVINSVDHALVEATHLGFSLDEVRTLFEERIAALSTARPAPDPKAA